MSALGKYMRVFPLDTAKGRTTCRWAVLDRHDGDLGLIEWDNGWRQYVFIPAVAQFSAGCLNDIAKFLDATRSPARRPPPQRPEGRRPNERAVSFATASGGETPAVPDDPRPC